VAAGAAGNLSGAYKWKVSFLRGGLAQESGSSPDMALAVTLAAQSADLTLPLVPATSFADGTGRVIYRTLPDDFSRYYFVGIINDNVTVAFNDNIPDDDLGPELAPDDNNIPPRGANCVLYHKERTFVGLNNTIRFSAAAGHELGPIVAPGIHGAHPEIFPDTFDIPVGDAHEPIVRLSLLNDRLIIFKRSQIWSLYGSGPDDFVLDLVEPRIGCLAPYSVAPMPDRIFFLGQDEQPRVYQFDGVRSRPISWGIDETLDTRVDNRLIQEINNNAGELVPTSTFAAAGVHDHAYILSVPDAAASGVAASSATPPDRFMLTYHWPSDGWFEYTNLPVSAMTYQHREFGGGALYMGSSRTVFVFQYDQQESVDHVSGVWADIGGGEYAFSSAVSTAVAMSFTTGALRTKEMTRYDTFKEVHIACNRPTPAATITVQRRYDLQTIAGIPAERTEAQLTSAPRTTDPSSLFTTLRFGSNLGRQGTSGGQLIADQGYMMQLRISADNPVQIYEYGVTLEQRERR